MIVYVGVAYTRGGGCKMKALVPGWICGLCGRLVLRLSPVKYLGALFGDVSPAEAYEKSVSTLVDRCLHASRMLLCSEERVQLVHTWCYPVLQATGVAFYPPSVSLGPGGFEGRVWSAQLEADIRHPALPPL